MAFRLVPERDPQIWADRSKLFLKMESIFRVKDDQTFPSKILVVWGAFGAGKSHLLRHFKWQLEKENTGFVLFSPFPKERVTGFHELYQIAFAERTNFFLLGKTFANIWKSYESRGETEFLLKITEETDYWYDFAQVVLLLGKLFSNHPNLNDPYFFLSRNWLSGYKLLKSERNYLNVRNDIRTDSDAIRLFSSMVRLLTSLGGLKFVVWMLDDCHVLLSKSLEKRKDMILHSLKTAFDECPNNLILILSFATKDPDAVEDFLIPDLLRRIRRIEIPALTEEDAYLFIKDLILMYQNVNNPIYYPFKEKTCIEKIIGNIAKTGLTPGNLMSYLDKLVSNAENNIFPSLITTDFIRKFSEKEEYE